MVKPIVFPAKFHQAFAKINFLIVPTVSYETSFSEKCINITGKIDGETYSEPSRTSKITLFGEIVNDFHSLTNFRKSSILVVQLGSKYVSGIFSLSWMKRFAIALMLKSSNRGNCQIGLCSRGIKVRYFLLNTYKYFNMEVVVNEQII